MKNFFDTTLKYVTHFQERLQKAWHMFLFMPAYYWKSMLVVFGAIFLIILSVDAWLFWRFTRIPQYDQDELVSELFTLKRDELETVLKLLHERELKLRQTGQTAPPREIFNTTQTSASTE